MTITLMGVQFAILNGGHVVWTYTSGQRNAEMRLPMTENTDIWAASITKGVFATWVMQLAEQHRIDLGSAYSTNASASAERIPHL